MWLANATYIVGKIPNFFFFFNHGLSQPTQQQMIWASPSSFPAQIQKLKERDT